MSRPAILCLSLGENIKKQNLIYFNMITRIYSWDGKIKVSKKVDLQKKSVLECPVSLWEISVKWTWMLSTNRPLSHIKLVNQAIFYVQ